MKSESGFFRPFFRVGVWVTDRFLRPDGAACKKLARELRFVEDQAGKQDVKVYYAEKIAKFLTVLFWGAGLCLLVALLSARQDQTATIVARPSYGEGTAETQFQVEVEGEEQEVEIALTLQERQYTDEELTELFAEKKRGLWEIMRGENESQEEVRSALSLPASLGGGVTAAWTFSPSDLIDASGEIVGETEETGTLVEVVATLTCQGQSEEYHFSIRVFSPERSREEVLTQQIEDALQSANEREPSEASVTLPQEIDGKGLTWRSPQTSAVGMLALAVLIAAVCAAVNADEKIHRMARDKEVGLRMEYATFLYKLTVLLWAGLTIRAAFYRMAGDYRGSGEQRRERQRYVYREVIACCNEMDSGVSEAQAYENFGQRCQLPEYIRLGSILSQNLRKGSDGLADLLEREAMRGSEERQNLARKLGEQAGTKLLLPMMLMLVVVLIILLVPAMFSFSF